MAAFGQVARAKVDSVLSRQVVVRGRYATVLIHLTDVILSSN